MVGVVENKSPGQQNEQRDEDDTHDTVPLHPTSKPASGFAPTSHWFWVVGGVQIPENQRVSHRVEPRPWPTLTSASFAIGETSVRVDAVAAFRETFLADTVLTIGELTDCSRWAVVGVCCEAEAATRKSVMWDRVKWVR